MAKELHVYIAPDASGLNFNQAVGDKDVFVQFIDGNYRTDDDDLAEAIDAAIKAGHLSRWVRKVDRSAAEKLARQHMAMRESTGAQTGQQTSQATANLNMLQARDQEMHKMGNESDVVDKLKDESDLMLTEDSSGKQTEKKPAGINFAAKA